MTRPTDVDRDLAVTSRRRFLRDGAVIGGAVVAGGLGTGSLGTGGLGAGEARAADADNLPPNVPEWTKTPGDAMGSQLYGTPSPFEKNIVKNIPKNLKQYLSASGRTPLQDLDGIITPNGLFYERHHGGVPTIDPAQHRLMLHGLVDRPMIFTMEDLRRFPSQSRIHFLECSGNPAYTKPFGKTASDLVGLLSCAEWTGVSLKLVLQEAGLRPDAKWVVAEGADAAALTRSIPIETSKYTDLMPDGTAREFTFYMEAKSIITRPSGGQRLTTSGFHEITGIAWSGHGKIKRVDVSVDDGKTWQEAQLQEPVLTRALTRFRLPWHWDGQSAVIQSRAIDETGYAQPTLAELLAVRGDNSFYHNNAIWPWRIASDGEVTNAAA